MSTLNRTGSVGPFRIRDTWYESGGKYAPHAHGELQVSVLLRGTMTEAVKGVDHGCRAGDVCVKPPGLRHADRFDGTRILCLDASETEVQSSLREYTWHRGDAATAAAVRLAQLFVEGRGGTEALAGAMDELLAALPSRPIADRALARRAEDALNGTFATPMDMRALAAHLGVHPVYLARAFREQWGCSPREYVQRLRVRAAAHGLASTRHPLARIALDSGFADQSHMTRVFGRVMRVRPAAFRRLASS